MKTLWVVLTVFILGATTATSAQLGLYGSWWDTEDVDAGYGGGIKLSFPLVDWLALELRLSGYSNFDTSDKNLEDLMVVPVEADLVARFPVGDKVVLYAGGGAGYYVTPEYESKVALPGSLEPDIDPEDEFGGFAVGGVEISLTDVVSIFAEAKYTVVDINEVEIDGVTTDRDISLEGLGANAGIAFNL